MYLEVLDSSILSGVIVVGWERKLNDFLLSLHLHVPFANCKLLNGAECEYEQISSYYKKKLQRARKSTFA